MKPAAASAAFASVCLVAYAAIVLVFGAGTRWSPDWDSALYLLTARAMAEGEGYTYLGQPFFLRPPGFSWLLSWLFRDGTVDPAAANQLVMLCAGLAVASVFVLLRRREGTWIALATALLAGTHPLWVSGFNRVLSEYPFVALMLPAIALVDRATAANERRWLGALLGGALLAGAVYLRSAALLVLPALLVLVPRDGRRAAMPIVVAAVTTVVLVMPWWLHAGDAAADAPVPAEQMLLHDYGTALFHTDPGDPGSPRISLTGWIDRVETNGATLLRRLAGTSLPLRGRWAQVVLAALLLSGLVLRVRRGPAVLDAWSWAYVGLLLVYFTFARRLLLPLLPVVALYIVTAVTAAARWLGERLERPRAASAVATVVLGGLIVVQTHGLVTSLGDDGLTDAELVKARDTERVAAWLVENTPADAVVLCSDAPVLRHLTDRETFTYRFARRPAGKLLEHYAADYVVFDHAASRELTVAVAQRTRESWRLPSARPGAFLVIHRVRDR